VRAVDGPVLARGAGQGDGVGRHGHAGLTALVAEILLAICAHLRAVGSARAVRGRRQRRGRGRCTRSGAGEARYQKENVRDVRG
jgi:hypothetical protein